MGTANLAHGDGAWLRGLRVRSGMSQQELARRAGLSVRALRYLEGGGVARPQAASVRRLADALGVDPDDLIGRFIGRAPDNQAGRLRVDVLGPLVVRHGAKVVEIGSAMQRTLLGLLALQHGHVVGSGEIVDLLWPTEPPRTCLQLVHTYVGQVRRLLEPDRAARPAGLIVRRGGGYALELEQDQLDLAEFDRVVAQARQAWSAGVAQSAGQFYREAWDCWRGALLAGSDARLHQHPAAVAVTQRRAAAVLEWTDVAFSLATYDTVVGPLRVLYADEPLHEGLAARLMLALAGNGQQAAALALFDDVRDRLDAQLGVTPGPELKAAQLRVLRGRLPASARPAARATPAATPTAPPPAQLPADVDAFTGRGAQLDTLDALLPDENAAGPARVIVLAGMGGVGKTALAVHWSYRVSSSFPDGQLYVDLRGHSGEPPLRPIDALAGFLTALGVPTDQVPEDEAQAAALYRSRLAGRRVLVVLDNAVGAEQVRPLLPTGPGSLALVTGRDRMTGLIARDGARLVPLDALAPHESVALLDHMLGPRRAAAEPGAVADVARLCAHLPLALRIAAANLAARPRHRVADYAAKLVAGDRLGELQADGDTASAVRATFELSCTALPAAERRMFRLLGIAPGPDVAVGAAAALAEMSAGEAERALDRLSGRHLLHERAPGRYAMHDLLRLYAAELAEREEPDIESSGGRDLALTRLAVYYRARVAAAAQLLAPHLLYLPAPDAPQADPHESGTAASGPFADTADAVAWLDGDLPNLVALVRELGARGHHAAAWGLSDLMSAYFARGTNTVDWRLVAETAHAAALTGGDPGVQAATTLQLAMTDVYQGRYEASAVRLTETAALAEQAGWTQCQAVALNNLARCQWTAGLVEEPISSLTEALALHRRAGRVAGEAVTLANLGAAHADRGREPNPGPRERESLELAIRYLSQALDLHRRIGDRRNEGDTLRALAEAHRDLGDLDEALKAATQALELALANEEPRFTSSALIALGTVHVRSGAGSQGLDELSRALEVARSIQDPRLIAETHLALADSHRRLHTFDEALLHLDDARDLARQLRSGMLDRQCLRATAGIEASLALARDTEQAEPPPKAAAS
jgi:DNA-binding SARP family transcriptional activator/tetratricopeptide (TPR) repeat protein/DNA-binding XRE family transcriptional regulator